METVAARDTEADEMRVTNPAPETHYPEDRKDPSWAEAQQDGPALHPIVEKKIDLTKELKEGYRDNSTFSKIIAAPLKYKAFRYDSELL